MKGFTVTVIPHEYTSRVLMSVWDSGSGTSKRAIEVTVNVGADNEYRNDIELLTRLLELTVHQLRG